MRRMITRLTIAQLIPVALRYVKKAFRKKKTSHAQPKAQQDHLDTAARNGSVEKIGVPTEAQQDFTN